MKRLIVLLALLGVIGCSGMATDGEQDPRRLERIAKIYSEGETKTTIALLEDYLESFPRDGLAWTILGHAYNDEDRLDDAKSAYNSAITVNPKQFQAITGLGVVYRKQGDDDAAMDAYKRALEIDANYAQAYSSMAAIALKRRDDTAALEYAKKGYDLDTADPVIAANLSLAYHYNNDFENRDKFKQIAASLGYHNMATLEQLFSGELTIRD